MVEEHPGGVDPKQALFHFNERCWTANERGLSLVVVIQQFGFQDPMIITFPLKLAINWSESTIFGQTHVAESQAIYFGQFPIVWIGKKRPQMVPRSQLFSLDGHLNCLTLAPRDRATTRIARQNRTALSPAAAHSCKASSMEWQPKWLGI